MKNSFSENCYKILKKVPSGYVTTYKEITKKLNSKAYRAVGSAMNKNSDLIKIPCHRVVNADGKVGGYVKGSKEKTRLLKKEGIEIINHKIDLKKYLFKF